MKKFIGIIAILFFWGACEKNAAIVHVGKMCIKYSNTEIDTICVSLENSSGMGNFYFNDSIITFVDEVNCRFYDISLDGQLIDSYFGKGNGKDEIRSLLFAYPIENDSLNRGIIVDNNDIVTVFNMKHKNIDYSKRLDFDWENRKHAQYNSPSLYNIPSFTDFGVSFYLESDSLLIFPVNIVNRMTSTPDRIVNKRYKKGAIWGKLNLHTMKVTEVMGKFPEIYKENPVPHMEFFQYACSNHIVYVNHVIDSLIYVYKYPDELQYTIGYECLNIDRDYTFTKTIDYGNILENDLQHVGINSGLMFCSENNTLCRTYVKSIATGLSGMQIYENNDLVADVEMPAFFKLLGYKNGCYYGACFTPKEEMETTNLILYKIKFID